NRTLHIRNTLFTLIDEGIVPVINENDSVCVDEINSIGDNDTLSALTANLWSADLLIIMSDIDGVFDKDPKTHEDAKLITKITNIDETMGSIDTEGKSSFGTGGIVCKIEAARTVNEFGSDMILLNGKKKDIIISALEGTEKGTLFACE
ncbi:MAG: glutamate 5-kinase, partial [Firmicutes bacterium]|nr:glutamate 5-kinase [Bacillota bacterium]